MFPVSSSPGPAARLRTTPLPLMHAAAAFCIPDRPVHIDFLNKSGFLLLRDGLGACSEP